MHLIFRNFRPTETDLNMDHKVAIGATPLGRFGKNKVEGVKIQREDDESNAVKIPFEGEFQCGIDREIDHINCNSLQIQLQNLRYS